MRLNTTQEKMHILVIGDGGVGKTSYIKKQLGERFDGRYHSTEGINMYETGTDIWYDFPGQEKYGSHPFNDSDKIDLVIYMYDLTKKLSYNNLSYWRKYVNKNYGNISYVTIGNKSDLITHNITDVNINTNKI
jgi:GTP-binding nuclear protein Ran